MRRTLLLLAALLIAAMGTALVYAYVKGADSRAAKGLQRVTVLVAAKDVDAGTPAGSVQVKPATVVRDDLVPGSVSTMNGITGQLKVGLLKGQQISRLAFDRSTGTTATSGTTVSVAVTAANQADGTVQAGDHVNVYKIAGSNVVPVMEKADVVHVSPTTVLFNVPDEQAVLSLLKAQASGTLVLTKPSS